MPPEAAIASSSHPPRRREEPDKTKSPVADGSSVTLIRRALSGRPFRGYKGAGESAIVIDPAYGVRASVDEAGLAEA
jgi:hypothetical protein